MTRETITLDPRAQWRLYVLNHILAGETSIAEAAGLLGRSVRSVRRLLARYRGPDGAGALVHGNAGRAPAHRLDPEVRARVVELAQTRYLGVNREHLAELLADELELHVARARCAGCSRRRVCRSCAGDARGATAPGATG